MFKNANKKKIVKIIMIGILLSIVGLFFFGYLLNEQRKFEKIGAEIKVK